MEDLDALEEELHAAIAGAPDMPALERARVAALGRKSRLSREMKGIGGLDIDARKEAGARLNRIKAALAAAADARHGVLERAALDRRLSAERVDVTLPPRPETEGAVHPISQTLDELIVILASMGFQVFGGPDIEDDFHNFTALNIPPEHPARQMHDTFYFAADEAGERMLLRTHTSPLQIRIMRAAPPPYRIIAPGRTYRCDYDMTHTPMFHQIEGLVIDESTHMGHLKGCLIDLVRAFFEVEDLPVRFRPSYFPFTEPSAEMDIGCSREGGGLGIGKGGDWMEILGCGMVHPKVLEGVKNDGLDPKRHQGFAFGIGVERLAMLKYGIPDLRSFFDADLRWLRHYGFRPFDMPSLVSGLSA